MKESVAPERSAKETLIMWLEMIGSGDFSKAPEILDDDIIAEWPQSNERVVGRDNLIAIMTHYPGGTLGTHIESATFTEEVHERYVMTPMFTAVKATGSGNRATGSILTRYPDGSDWYIVMSADLHEGKITRNEAYFAPVYDAPKWRAKWVEPINP